MEKQLYLGESIIEIDNMDSKTKVKSIKFCMDFPSYLQQANAEAKELLTKLTKQMLSGDIEITNLRLCWNEKGNDSSPQ